MCGIHKRNILMINYHSAPALCQYATGLELKSYKLCTGNTTSSHIRTEASKMKAVNLRQVNKIFSVQLPTY